MLGLSVGWVFNEVFKLSTYLQGMLPQITLFSLLLQLFLCFPFNFSFHLCQHVVPACNEFLLWVFPKAITADTLTSCPLIRGSKRYIREWWGLCIKTKPDNRRFLTLSLIEHYRWSGKATTCMRRRCLTISGVPTISDNASVWIKCWKVRGALQIKGTIWECFPFGSLARISIGACNILLILGRSFPLHPHKKFPTVPIFWEYS